MNESFVSTTRLHCCYNLYFLYPLFLSDKHQAFGKYNCHNIFFSKCGNVCLQNADHMYVSKTLLQGAGVLKSSVPFFV